ncbi:unnamed protein product [Meganyctiphanes norvegica]|uniref:DH domain-containing protein n=1 Tax=Meganyctiphanes norvegica TaxID=48144 RepID=A0AAV2Q2D8_MEGNR
MNNARSPPTNHSSSKIHTHGFSHSQPSARLERKIWRETVLLTLAQLIVLIHENRGCSRAYRKCANMSKLRKYHKYWKERVDIWTYTDNVYSFNHLKSMASVDRTFEMKIKQIDISQKVYSTLRNEYVEVMKLIDDSFKDYTNIKDLKNKGMIQERSEKSYFYHSYITLICMVYMEPLKKIQVDGYAMFAEPELLFGNLDELCCVTYAFCKEFINLLEQHQVPGGQLDITNVLVKLFQKGSKATMLCQAYHRYALNYINALNYLETLRRQMEFCEFEKWCNRDPRCKKLQLTDLLVAPVQHIMKVPLILRDIEVRTEDPQERQVVREIIEAEEHSLRELDDKMKWLKNFERLLEIQRNIVWPPITDLDPKVYIPEFLKSAISRQPCERLIVSPRRQIILEGSLHLLDHNKPQEMYVILFDDMLLITRKRKAYIKSSLHKPPFRNPP